MTEIERGAIYTVAAKGAYTGKPRPAIVLQTNDLRLDSVVVVPLTTESVGETLTRIAIPPGASNGLKNLSYAMCDKISTVPAINLRDKLGSVDRLEMRQIEAALLIVLGFPD
jgi:mRNA interferase MazF